MKKYIITISYDGSKYDGLQKLKNGHTIQGELESVLERLNEAPVKVSSSGRTDKGVHALDQRCTFELQKDIDSYRLRYYIDKMTTKYLYVKSCDYLEDENFHPRFSIKTKTYKYIINIGPYDPIKTDYVYNYNKDLDVDAMKEATREFLGPHNFRAFVVGPQKTCDSIIENIKIEKEKGDIIIRIQGKAFYTYMVRNIVSALILVGSNKLNSSDITEMLETGKKTIEYSPAPPGGLYLEKLEY